MKQEGEKIACLTAYDASFAKLFDTSGVEVLLIGDSLGMVLKGEDDTLSVSVEEIAYHVKSVRAGTNKSMVVADMPFMSYSTPELACTNAAKLMANGANMVKLEGGDWLYETIKQLVERGVPVCGHLGLTPQSVNVFGGFKVQGRNSEQAEALLQSAKQLEQAGIQLLVLECVPQSLAEHISQNLSVPVIGIGAGADTDGQILVMHDMIGVSANYMPKFSKDFLAETGSISKAVEAYVSAVKSGDFPSNEHSFD